MLLVVVIGVEVGPPFNVMDNNASLGVYIRVCQELFYDNVK